MSEIEPDQENEQDETAEEPNPGLPVEGADEGHTGEVASQGTDFPTGEQTSAAQAAPSHLDDQLGEDSGVEEALQAWAEGGHDPGEFENDDEIAAVRFPQLEPAVPKVQGRSDLLNNVWVDVAVELGRKEMMVSQVANLKEQDVIELNKLAGEAFEIRVNGRLFAQGEVVVVSDLMAVRITNLINNPDTDKANEQG